jgi:hypothetical protein
VQMSKERTTVRLTINIMTLRPCAKMVFEKLSETHVMRSANRAQGRSANLGRGVALKMLQKFENSYNIGSTTALLQQRRMHKSTLSRCCCCHSGQLQTDGAGSRFAEDSESIAI